MLHQWIIQHQRELLEFFLTFPNNALFILCPPLFFLPLTGNFLLYSFPMQSATSALAEKGPDTRHMHRKSGIFLSFSEFVLCAQQNLPLHYIGKVDKIIAVSADAHHKISVFFRFLLRGKQFDAINHVDLHLEAAAIQIDMHKLQQLFQGFHCKRAPEELQIDGNAAEEALMSPACGEKDGSRWGVVLASRAGVGVFSQGEAGQPSAKK